MTGSRELMEADWLELVEARRRLINPHLDSLTMGKFSDVKCIRYDGHHTKGIDHCDEVTGVGGYSLESQGIFGYTHSAVKLAENRRYPDGQLTVWGLSRKGVWLVVEVTFTGHSGHKDRGRQHPTKVVFREVELAKMCQQAEVAPKQVWEELGSAVHQWAVARQQLCTPII